MPASSSVTSAYLFEAAAIGEEGVEHRLHR